MFELGLVGFYIIVSVCTYLNEVEIDIKVSGSKFI